jgi:hypothetical protein
VLTAANRFYLYFLNKVSSVIPFIFACKLKMTVMELLKIDPRHEGVRRGDCPDPDLDPELYGQLPLPRVSQQGRDPDGGGDPDEEEGEDEKEVLGPDVFS